MKYSPALADELKKKLEAPLPGWEAQRHMAPPGRTEDWKIPAETKKSGVLVLLYPQSSQVLNLVLMKRAEDGRTHGGQISFPGGRWEETDIDYIDTALREAEEEVGVPKGQVEVIGQLTDLYIPPSNFMVYPTLGIAHQRPKFIPDPVEVAEVIEVELSTLLSEEVKGSYEINHRQGFQFKTPGYEVKGHTVWGATAMILSELGAILK